MKPSTYKVLVVDDDEATSNLIVTLLSTPGHHCVLADDGREALDNAVGNKFDAVISGMAIRGMDGIALTRELSRRFPRLPVMILTGHDHPHSAATAVAAGAREFMEKPFSIVEFVIRFHKMMHQHEVLCGTVAVKDEIIFNLHRELAGKMERTEAEKEELPTALAPVYLGL